EVAVREVQVRERHPDQLDERVAREDPDEREQGRDCEEAEAGEAEPAAPPPRVHRGQPSLPAFQSRATLPISRAIVRIPSFTDSWPATISVIRTSVTPVIVGPNG